MDYSTQLLEYVQLMVDDERLGCVTTPFRRRVLLEYGCMNLVEPFHANHLRGLLIGHSIARIRQFYGDEVFKTMYVQDWGLSVAMTMSQLQSEQPRLPYFAPDFTGQFADNPPHSYSDIRKWFQVASQSVHSLEFWKVTQAIMSAFQNSHWGVRSLWRQWVQTTISHYQANFNRFGIHFDLWLGESDVRSFLSQVNPSAVIPEAAQNRLAALIQHVIELRMEHLISIVSPHEQDTIDQVSACAHEIVSSEGVLLDYVPFGHMHDRNHILVSLNDGTLSLNGLLTVLTPFILEHQTRFRNINLEPEQIAFAALKLTALSVPRRQDFFFDGGSGIVEKCCLFFHTLDHISAMMQKVYSPGWEQGNLLPPIKNTERRILVTLAEFPNVVMQALDDFAPHHIALYGVKLCVAYQNFSHECHIPSSENNARRASWLHLTTLTGKVLHHTLFLLGIDVPSTL